MSGMLKYASVMLDQNSPLVRQSKHQTRRIDLAHTIIVDAIIECQLPPGSMVSEAELEARYQLGLASIRAGLARLAATDLVVSQGRKGWQILPLSAENLYELQEARRCLEPLFLKYDLAEHLRTDIAQKALIYQRIATSADAITRLRYERDLLRNCASAVVGSKLRTWLIEVWDLSIRADYFFKLEFGIQRDMLPLAELAEFLVSGDRKSAFELLTSIRESFSRRCSEALARSTTNLVPRQAASISKLSNQKNVSNKPISQSSGTGQGNHRQGEPS